MRRTLRHVLRLFHRLYQRGQPTRGRSETTSQRTQVHWQTTTMGMDARTLATDPTETTQTKWGYIDKFSGIVNWRNTEPRPADADQICLETPAGVASASPPTKSKNGHRSRNATTPNFQTDFLHSMWLGVSYGSTRKHDAASRYIQLTNCGVETANPYQTGQFSKNQLQQEREFRQLRRNTLEMENSTTGTRQTRNRRLRLN